MRQTTDILCACTIFYTWWR